MKTFDSPYHIAKMEISFDQIWEALKWALLIVVIPSARFIWNWISGKNQRRLNAIDDLLVRVERQAERIGELTDELEKERAEASKLRLQVLHLTKKVEQLTAELQVFTKKN